MVGIDIELVAARWALGLLPGSELPGIAMQALESGLDSSAVRELAGERNPALSDVSPLFERALVEVDAPRPSREEAALILAKYYARAIVGGSITPYQGAKAIWQEAADIVRPSDHTLDPFIYWADEIEGSSDPERKAQCVTAIRASARELADL